MNTIQITLQFQNIEQARQAAAIVSSQKQEFNQQSIINVNPDRIADSTAIATTTVLSDETTLILSAAPLSPDEGNESQTSSIGGGSGTIVLNGTDSNEAIALTEGELNFK